MECENLIYFTNMSGEKMHCVYPNEAEVYIVEVVFICDKYQGELKIQEEEVEGLQMLALHFQKA